MKRQFTPEELEAGRKRYEEIKADIRNHPERYEKIQKEIKERQAAAGRTGCLIFVIGFAIFVLLVIFGSNSGGGCTKKVVLADGVHDIPCHSPLGEAQR